MPNIPTPSFLMVSAKRANPRDANTVNEQPTEQVEQPAFTTTQSVTTFSGASAVIAAVWKAVAGAGVSGADSRWVPAVICILVAIYLIAKGLESADSLADKFGVVLIGVFNTIFLWAAVVGIDVGLTSTGVTNDPTGG
jgi:hypothetical protein